MKINKARFVEEFGLRGFGAKGFLHSKYLPCPFCGGGGDKFGVKIDDKGGVFNCFRCGTKGSIFKLLKKINRLDLLSKEGEDFSFKDKLDEFILTSGLEEEDITCEEISKPLGFKPIEYDEYLQNRGFEDWQYKSLNVGISIDPRLKNMVTFLLLEDNKIVGYLSRSRKSKEWHKNNLEKAKKGLCKLVLRYENSAQTKFERVVGGIDEVIEGETKTVLLVEGIMDKANTDRVLGLNKSPEVKCCFTFGCKLSDAQMLKIFRKGVENIVLLYDPGTIQQVKTTSLRLLKYFNISIGELLGNKDPGEMNIFDFEKVLLSLKDPMEYYLNRIPEITLR